jgi:uncharacterized protein (TIGR03437 family)
MPKERQAMRRYQTNDFCPATEPKPSGRSKLRAGAALVAAIALVGLFSTTRTALAQSQPTGPVITGVGDSASYSAYIAWGELVSIFGTNLSDGGTYQAQTVPLPTQLGTTQVFAYGEPLGLLYVSPTQINVLISTSNPPQNCQGVGGQCVDFTVQVGGAVSPAWNNGYALYAPALFSSGFDCPFLGWPNAAATNVSCGLSAVQKPGQFPRPIVTDANYSLITNSNPAQLGQPYVLWLTGLGNPGNTGDLRSQFPTLRNCPDVACRQISTVSQATRAFSTLGPAAGSLGCIS